MDGTVDATGRGLRPGQGPAGGGRTPSRRRFRRAALAALAAALGLAAALSSGLGPVDSGEDTPGGSPDAGLPLPAQPGSISQASTAPAAAPVAAAPEPSLAATPPLTADAAAAIAAAVDRQARAGARISPVLGVHVIDLATGDEVYGRRAGELHVIASNTKLVTTAAALDALGPGHLFETRVLMRGKVAGGVLDGDLAVIGGGDPNISGRHFDGDPYAVFRRWAEALRARGVTRITGDLYLEHGRFTGPTTHPDWPERGRDKWYQAPVAALSFSDNCVLVRIRPARRVGAAAEVELVPPLGRFGPLNRVSTTSSLRGHQAGVRRAEGSDELTVWGSVYQRASPLETWVSVTDPVQYFGAALVDALAGAGVTVEGGLVPVERLPGLIWEGVAVHRTDLLTAVQVTNKRSQNFYAESLIKLLGAERCGRGSWEAGLKAAEEFLAGAGIEPGSYSMADGSGLSRNNLFTPSQLTVLLRHMYFHRHGKEFLRSLPYSGEEELSWRSRLASPPYRGNVFAKTGTLLGVSTLSGYAKGRSGRLYAFSILCNRASSTWEARRLQDRVVAALVDAG
jgi:D-alanyl-D-alanine carboxypeptidase/D-alanyl-D-alanine-endopeptidase (penicillin-binding protein 4)